MNLILLPKFQEVIIVFTINSHVSELTQVFLILESGIQYGFS